MFLEWEETYGPRTKKGNGWFYKTSQRSDDGYQVNGVRVYRVIGGKKEYMGQGAKLIYYETIVSDEPQVGVVAVLDPSMNEDKAAEIILAHDDDDGRFSLHTRTADQDAEDMRKKKPAKKGKEKTAKKATAAKKKTTPAKKTVPLR